MSQIIHRSVRVPSVAVIKAATDSLFISPIATSRHEETGSSIGTGVDLLANDITVGCMVGIEEAKVGSGEGVFVNGLSLASTGEVGAVGESGPSVNVGVGVEVGVAEGGRQSRKQF